MNKRLYEMDLVEDFECSFKNEADGREGRFITVEEYDGRHKVWYDPQGIKVEDLSYLLKLDVKLFNIFYEYTCEIYDYSCFDSRGCIGVEEVSNKDYQFYFDDSKYKDLRLF